MADILVRNLSPIVVRRLKESARKQGRSLQSEVKTVLEEAANRPRLDSKTALARARRLRASFGKQVFSDSVELIREDRDR